MLSIYSITLFLSAFLLFWVQLMVAKMILPLLGGSPAVWNGCVCFFQVVLLGGYGYAHLMAGRRWRRSPSLLLHLGMLLLPVLFLPIALPDWVPPTNYNPVVWLLALLAVAVAVPFFAVSTTAPLMQKWFAETGDSAGKDPYFLYAASNLGSLLSLVLYPTLLEPHLTLSQQGVLWSVGYGLLVGLVGLCAVGVWRSPDLAQADEKREVRSLTGSQQWRWVMLSFLPSSLLLSVTTYITTDLAAVPLLWAVPLMIYLMTFILAFGRRVLLPRQLFITLMPLLLTPLCLLFLLQVSEPLWLLLPLHLLGLFWVAAAFHGELAFTRPDPQYLTVFYFWVALGGVLGGVFNAIAAPLLFPAVQEYPLVLLLSLLVLWSPDFREMQVGRLRLRSLLLLSLGLLFGAALVGFSLKGLSQNIAGGLLIVGLLLGSGDAFRIHKGLLGVGAVLILLLNQFELGISTTVLTTERSFFGVYRVNQTAQMGGFHSLLHGTTLHGKQSLDPQRRDEPLTYFSRTGPVGQLFASLPSSELQQVGVLGLGVGTLATYAQPHQQWTFYEIDPLAEKLALDPRYFTFLHDSRAPIQIVLGDGRLAIAQSPHQFYDLLFMDAFSSDSIPVHLITREAVELYFQKLTQRGLLVVNITNRFLDLEPVLGAIAQSLNLATLTQWETDVPESDRRLGKAPSHWVLLARQLEDFGSLVRDPRWHPIPTTTQFPWTDDFSNLFGAIRRKSP